MLKRHALYALPFIVAASSAHAQSAVMCVNCTDEITTVANNIAVAANWVTQLERAAEQIKQQTLIFQQLSGTTNVNAIAAVLNQARNWNQLGAFGNVTAQLQGIIGATGAALPIGSSIPMMNITNQAFNRRSSSLANVQAMSAAMLANATGILAGLATLRQEIDQQPSAQAMLGINARLASYQGNINTQQYQLAQMRAFADAQQKVLDQRVQQAGYCADYEWVNATHSLSGAGPNVAAADCAADPVATPIAATEAAVPVAAATPADTAGFDTPIGGGS